jgi:RNA polymerase sigma-54 factor
MPVFADAPGFQEVIPAAPRAVRAKPAGRTVSESCANSDGATHGLWYAFLTRRTVMRMSFGQEMRMAQKQLLAPRMIQSMEILQLPALALEERIEQEIENNEALERVEPEEPSASLDGPPLEPASPPQSSRTVDEKPLVVDQEHANRDDFERSYDWSVEYPDSDDDRSRPSASRLEESGDRYLDTMANMQERPETLCDHLHEQLALADLPEEERQAADRIIYNLDANGYLPMPLVDLVDPDGPPGQLARLERALEVVQSLEPAGVAARDLRECLLLQVRPDLPDAEDLRRLISDHLSDLAANRLPLIERRTGLSIEAIERLRERLHTFKPKPGAIFTPSVVPVVKPDAYVEQLADGTWKVRLDEIDLPSLRISPYYRELLASADTDPATRDYIKRKINAGQWLIESIEQRRSTLLKTAQAIVDHQTRFLSEGPEAIEPLKMQQIADRIGMHVTTVSRAVDDKWLQTPRGLHPLRRFFVGGTVSADGEEVAWDAVRLKLQEIIDGEQKESPFSDDELVEELAKRGITLARRTVTKYRKAMDIPSSRQRRDWKLARSRPPVSADPDPPAGGVITAVRSTECGPSD